MEEEDWQCWIKDGLISELEKHEYDIPENDVLWQIYLFAKEAANEYFIVEMGGNGWIDIDKLVKVWNDAITEYEE